MTFPNASALFYRYLLGELTDEEKHKIEERSLTDGDYRERLQITERELIAAYVSGNLTLDKRERFEKHFLCSGERLEKLRLAESLYEYVRTDVTRFPNASAPLYGYLLGELALDEEMKIKERLLIDDSYKERLEIVKHELIAAYTLENLSEAKRDRFERYFLSSEERVKKLRFAEALCEYVERVESPGGAGARWFDRPQRWLAEPVYISVGYRNVSRPIWQPLAAVLVIGISALILAALFHQPAVTKGLNALSAAYAWERPVEARITGFGYAKYPAGHNRNVIAFDRHRRDEAFSLIIGQVVGNESPAAYHALGNFYLTGKDFNEAVKCFELALRNNTGDAKSRNDLAVALMEREKEKAKNPGQSAQSGGDDFAGALEHLHRAIELDGLLLEAHFNLALCHQYQMLWRTAEEDWKRYLEKDSQSPWAEEARKNLEKIAEKIQKVGENRENIYLDFLEAYRKRNGEQAWQAYKHSRLTAGSFITDRLIDSYLSLALSGKSSEASDNLSALLFIGDAELEKVNDRFTHDLAQFYRGATPQQLRKLSVARGLVTAANERLEQSRLEEAIKNYLQAIKLFDQAGDVCESLAARRRLGHCYFRQASASLSSPVLMQGRQESETRSYLWLLGMFLNDLVNVNASLTKYSTALGHGMSQVNYAKRIEDDYGVLRGINRVTETYVLLARHREALPMIQEGLSVAGVINADQNQLIGLYLSASKCHMVSGKLMAALDYQKEAFKLSLEINNPWLISRHYVHLGLAYSKLNKHSEAVRLMRHSGKMGERLQDGKMGREITAFSHLHLGEIYRETGDLDSSLKSYRDALRFCDENDIDNQRLRFLAKKGILLTHIKRGDDSVAEEELKQVLDLYEQHRKNIEDENSRNNFFENEQGIYDIAIEYAYFKRQDARRAFDLSEMSRARSLLDTVDLPAGKLPESPLPAIRLPRSIQPLNLEQIQGQLPGRIRLLQYSVLDDHLIIWVVSGPDLKSRFVEVGQEKLDNRVSEYLQLLAGGRDAKQGNDYRARSSDLYNLLIKPVENLLDKDAEICIIPDKVLNRVPFASLIAQATGKYLIEERVIFTAPSANMFLVASDRARQKESVKTERLLSVGNPWIGRAAFRDLKDLTWAATQASEISAFYQASTVLLEKNARESSVRKEVEKSDVAHFATHYVADERSPMLSALPLADERNPASKDGDGVLHTFEFYNMNLSRLRLVVLSACQTGIDQYYKGEGAVGLARAFQAAGIPLVVASLWPVESYPTKELMIGFHRHRKRGELSTAQALRQAQLDMIRSTDPELRNPCHWAAYTVIGGHANF